MSIMCKYHWYPFGKNSTVVCYSEHAQAKGDVFVMWSPWLFLIGQEEEAALSSASALSCSQTGWSSASSAHAQYVPVCSCMYITHLLTVSASELIFSLSLSVSRGHRPVVSVGLSEQTQRSSRCRSEGSAGGVLPARTGELYSHNPY